MTPGEPGYEARTGPQLDTRLGGSLVLLARGKEGHDAWAELLRAPASLAPGVVFMSTDIDRPGPEPIVGRGPRIEIGTMLLLTAALAPLIALYARINANAEPLVSVLALVVTGLAVGAARRASAGMVAAQVAIAALIAVAAIERQYGPLRPYVLLTIVAATVVAPLTVRNNLDRISEPRRGRIKAVADVAWNTGLNLVAVAVFQFAQENYFPHATTTLFIPPPALTAMPVVPQPPMPIGPSSATPLPPPTTDTPLPVNGPVLPVDPEAIFRPELRRAERR